MAKTNAVFLLLVLPFLSRIWFEAVVWRIRNGPQMLGFSLIHAGAGVLTIPLVGSLFALWIYWLFALVIIAMWFFPGVRREMTGTKFVVLGGMATYAFGPMADLMQNELPAAAIYLGALVLAALIFSCLWLSVLSFRESKSVAVSQGV